MSVPPHPTPKRAGSPSPTRHSTGLQERRTTSPSLPSSPVPLVSPHVHSRPPLRHAIAPAHAPSPLLLTLLPSLSNSFPSTQPQRPCPTPLSPSPALQSL